MSGKTAENQKPGENTAVKDQTPAKKIEESANGKSQNKDTKTTEEEKQTNKNDDDIDESGPYEDIDISDPPPEDPDWEKLEQKDAPHSSYNSHADHKWKYDPPPPEEPFSALRPKWKPRREEDLEDRKQREI